MARAVLRATTVAQRAGRPIDGLRRWARDVQGRGNHNKAACALANKMARICYATLRDGVGYGKANPRLQEKMTQTAYAIAA